MKIQMLLIMEFRSSWKRFGGLEWQFIPGILWIRIMWSNSSLLQRIFMSNGTHQIVDIACHDIRMRAGSSSIVAVIEKFGNLSSIVQPDEINRNSWPHVGFDAVNLSVFIGVNPYWAIEYTYYVAYQTKTNRKKQN